MYFPNLRIKYCIPEIKYPNILYTQKPWLTLTIGRSHEETRNVFQLKKAWASFVFRVKKIKETSVKRSIFTQGERNLWNFACQIA